MKLLYHNIIVLSIAIFVLFRATAITFFQEKIEYRRAVNFCLWVCQRAKFWVVCRGRRPLHLYKNPMCIFLRDYPAKQKFINSSRLRRGEKYRREYSRRRLILINYFPMNQRKNREKPFWLSVTASGVSAGVLSACSSSCSGGMASAFRLTISRIFFGVRRTVLRSTR